MRNSKEGLQAREAKSLRIGSILRSIFTEPKSIDTTGTMLSVDPEMRAQMTPEGATLLEAYYMPETPEECAGLIRYEMSGKEDTKQPPFDL